MKSTENGVDVLRKDDRAYYSGLMTCGSIWLCPVCASKISEARRQELIQAMETWKADGGQVVMVIYTLPHSLFQPLSDVLGGLTKARTLMMHRKAYKTVKRRLDLAGSVRSLEVTHGVHGWHAHFHELLFIPAGVEVDPQALRVELLLQWQSACTSTYGLIPNEHGVVVQDAAAAAKYASKWGLESEMTKSHVKRGKDGGLTPFDLLRAEKKELFQEYAECFKGRRQLYWSKGLRDRLGLGKEKSDEDLAGQVDEEAAILGNLTAAEWDAVLKADARGELLRVAQSSGWAGVIRYIGKITECPF